MKKYNPVISNPIPINEEGHVRITHVTFWFQATKLRDEYQKRQMEEIHIEPCPDRGGYILFFYLEGRKYKHLQEVEKNDESDSMG